MQTNLKRVLCLLLCLAMLPAAASCGKGEKSSDTEKPNEGEVIDVIPCGYLEKYGDISAAEKWRADNIENTDTPPVYFAYGGKPIGEYVWTKETGAETALTDYASSDHPVNRIVREIKYTCAELPLEITLTLTRYPNYPIVEYEATVVNTSDENTKRINKTCAVNSDLCELGGDSVIHYNRGTTIKEDDFEPLERKLNEGRVFRAETTLGQPTEAYLPYFNIEDAENGKGVIAAINWQGDWFAECMSKNGKLNFMAGQYSTDYQLMRGESFRIPGMVLLFYKDGDWQFGQNIWRRWIVEHNMMRYNGSREFTQNVYLCSDISRSSTDITNIKAIGKTDLPKKYTCVFEIDAGWHDSGSADWTYTGNWYPNSRYDDGALKKISDACHDAGMKFSLWFEPERLFYNTDTYNKLPEGTIFLKRNGEYFPHDNFNLKDGIEWGIIDYSTKQAQDWAIELIDNAIKEYGLDIYRQDFNTHAAQFWSAKDKYEEGLYGLHREGITENHACTGYLNVWREIAKRNPDIIFDACASGGRRLDLETVRFSFAHTKSDYNAEVKSAQCQIFGISSWYIFTGTGLVSPTNKYDVRSRLTLSAGLLASSAKASEKALGEWADNNRYLYNDYYQLTPYSLNEDAKIAMQFDDAENGEGMMIAYLRAGGELTLLPKGLAQDASYKIWDKDKTDDVSVISGKELCEKGYTVKSSSKAAIVIFYEKA